MSAAEAAPVTSAEARALFADFAKAPALILAVSGGPDSTALLVLAARWRQARKTGPKLVAVTIDHGLRPEARQEAAQVRRLARALGVTHRVLVWQGVKPLSGLQEAAREARYRLLAEAARRAGATHILTAHTRDDQAETVLFRLLRGSGLAGLAGMARLTPLGPLLLARPFLDLAKSRLIATLHKAAVSFADDPSNRDPRFGRTRLRALLPQLAEEGLGTARLVTLARRAARMDEALERITAASARALLVSPRPGAVSLAIDAARFAELPDEIALRLLGAAVAARATEGAVELGKLESLFDAVRASARRGLSLRRTLAGALVTVKADQIVIEPAPARRRPSAEHTDACNRSKFALTTQQGQRDAGRRAK